MGTPPPQFRVHSETRVRRRTRWSPLERLLLIIGVACLGYYILVSIEAALYQALENRELDAILASAPAESPTADPRAPLPAIPRPLPGAAIGRIEIPRLGVSVVIRAGADAKTLRRAVGHIPGTALPGELGNVGLAGHRDTFFRRLRNIKPDDEVRIVTPRGTYVFHVEDTRIVRPRDTWVLNATPEPTLTLITCYPFTFVGSAPQRFIVRAREAVRTAHQNGTTPPL